MTVYIYIYYYHRVVGLVVNICQCIHMHQAVCGTATSRSRSVKQYNELYLLQHI